MKIISFLNKLKKEGMLELVEPSEEIKQSYLKKSESNFISARILLDNNRLEEVVYLVYYSVYNVLLALLFKVGIKSENHFASAILLKEIFEIGNSFILNAKKEGINIQYYVDFNLTKKNIGGLIIHAEEFNGELLDFISKLTNERIDFYRDKFISLLGSKEI